MTRTAAADEVALARLYDETSRRVYGLVLRVVRDPALAERVTREVYLQAWSEARRRAGSEPAAATATMLLMVSAHRHAVDSVRSSETTTGPVEAEQLPVGRVADVPAVESAASTTTRVSLDRLPSAEREAVDLAYGGGYTHAEVAQLLGLGSAHLLIRDGLRTLQTMVAAPG